MPDRLKHEFTADNAITIAILAGGRGSRMGGRDKGLVEYQNRPLIQSVIDGIWPQNPQIILNANRNIERYEQFGFPVIRDQMDNFQGPLAGILSCMQFLESGYILTLPCDGPVVAIDYQQKMKASLNNCDAEIAVAYDGQTIQPAYALIPVKLKHNLEAYLKSGERKLGHWIKQNHPVKVEFPAQDGFFTNLNIPADLA